MAEPERPQQLSEPPAAELGSGPYFRNHGNRLISPCAGAFHPMK